jgi:hypothetical protein
MFPEWATLVMKTMFFVVVVTRTLTSPLIGTEQVVPVHPFDQSMMAPEACVTVSTTVEPRATLALVLHVPEQEMPAGFDAMLTVWPPRPWKSTLSVFMMGLHPPDVHV